MNKEEFIDMAKRMVVEYYNRYVHSVEPEVTTDTINSSYVNLEEFNINGDGVMEVLLVVSIDPWLQYHVAYNERAKGRKRKKIISYITLS